MNKLNMLDAVMKFFGLFVLAGTVLKGRLLVIEAVANKDIWSYRTFHIFVVEFESAQKCKHTPFNLAPDVQKNSIRTFLRDKYKKTNGNWSFYSRERR